MKRILLPAGGAILATGMLAAGLAGTANANPDWAADTMAKDAPAAAEVANFWLGANADALRKATPYSHETTAASKLKASGGYTPDGKPGVVAPIGEEKKSSSVVKNINLPRTIGKVFFVAADGSTNWCSATSIQSKYRNLVATAGHCVYDDKKNASVMDKWVFVPAYYQGKTPYGVFVGKTAYTHYDYSVFNDRDRDYAFVTVYNGVQIGGGSNKEVSFADYTAATGKKEVTETKVDTFKEYDQALQKGARGEIRNLATQDEVGPDYPGAEAIEVEVDKWTWDDAPKADGTPSKPGKKRGEPGKTGKAAAGSQVKLGAPEAVTKSVYDAYTGLGYKSVDAKGNYQIQHYYVVKYVKKDSKTEYVLFRYFVTDGFIKDTGALGDAVGGQGFTWNQKTSQTVYIFGYPAAAHPDGNKAFTGVTPKWCYGKTSGKVYVSAAEKVEEHVGLKCSMTRGADGAPWLVKYSNAKRLGYVNGVTSLFGDQDNNGRIDTSTSPYFDGETAAVYNKAAATWSGSIVK
ncbi:trypsin-like serine peptidase [Streptosporangium sp. NPDC087985]|uniref:trypsin-like serine peptidase n=1 Tax=Streptosporangium sp. NPDC087985 TaxID=3366196 RepID=UPI0037FBC7EE